VHQNAVANDPIGQFLDDAKAVPSQRNVAFFSRLELRRDSSTIERAAARLSGICLEAFERADA
jgi:hypothetical protein